MAGLVHKTRLGILIANMFAETAVRLTGDEQKAASATALKFPLNQANPHIDFQKLRSRQVRRVGGQKSGLSARGTSASLPS